VSDDYSARLRALSTEKALAVAAYGESVAAYRYRTLSQKPPSARHAKIFAEIADEEQAHHAQVQDVLRRHFPGSDFVLSASDKELVTIGPRMIEITDRASFDRALEWLYESERLTGRFYQTLHDVSDRADLRPLLKEMADECYAHAERLREIPPVE
jgi:rubrerythrin